MTLVRVGGNGTAPGRSLWMWCPGCNDNHRITFDAPEAWTWDGNEEAPTISPSLLVFSHTKRSKDGEIINTPQCHSFIRNGKWEFLTDCTHELAGQTVPMVPLPDWMNEEWVGQ